MYSDLGLVLVKVLPWGFPGIPWTELKRFHNSQAFQPVSYPALCFDHKEVLDLTQNTGQPGKQSAGPIHR